MLWYAPEKCWLPFPGPAGKLWVVAWPELQAMARASEELIRLVLVPDGTRVDVDGTSCWHQEKHSCWFSNKNKGYLMSKASNQSFFGWVLN